jgi:MoxR-like ATPase
MRIDVTTPSPTAAPEVSDADAQLLRQAAEGYHKLRQQIARVIIGQDAVVRQLLAAIFCEGHVLIVGVPGLAKTLLVKTLGEALGWSFKRIQFTPDMMPADIIGMEMLQDGSATVPGALPGSDGPSGARSWRFMRGPIFANLVLADEINRTPPKTQAALLEAMQEHRVTIQGRTYQLEEPFYVFATQNPIELEGTYPLPEAQLDRFMFHILMEHPPEEEELEVVRETTGIIDPHFNRPVSAEDLIAFQRLVRRVPVADPVLRYALQLVRTSRPKAPNAPESVKKWVAFGASVRAAQFLVLGAKARALTSGRYHVSFEDIRAMSHPVLRHRVLVNFRAESEGVSTDSIIDELLDRVPVPASGM